MPLTDPLAIDLENRAILADAEAAELARSGAIETQIGLAEINASLLRIGAYIVESVAQIVLR